ncbi:hypothetical protein INS49_005771 [Diaporthe citri]|uniref:uncharacterized protein n=1 Tax=Diaporthe citri TaxID=83186 RepID=UPI001C7EE409|nr:uncharacterized protein INS49_005771 [Diaporthe citri]KAG6364173.1 hypothetical protein INS49_005771 [Diaporthe citri]
MYGSPTPFFVGGYAASDRYPNGWADVAGYWAEHHIFGGVVLFDRGESEEECNGIYIHRPKSTANIAPPTEKQFNNLVDFLLSPNPDTAANRCPLPIRITEENKWRWHAYDGMVEHHIFMFRHEIPRRRPREQCVMTTTDWPEWRDQDTIETELIKEVDGEAYDEALVAAARERLKRTATPTSRCYWWDGEEQSRLQPDPEKQGRTPYFFDS